MDHSTKPSCNPHTFLVSCHYNHPYIYRRGIQSHRSMNRTARPFHDQIYFTRDNSQCTSLHLQKHPLSFYGTSGCCRICRQEYPIVGSFLCKIILPSNPKFLISASVNNILPSTFTFFVRNILRHVCNHNLLLVKKIGTLTQGYTEISIGYIELECVVDESMKKDSGRL